VLRSELEENVMTIPNEGRDGVTKDIKILLNEADPIWTTLRHEYVEGLLINKVVYKC
jgi:hypothetical protein